MPARFALAFTMCQITFSVMPLPQIEPLRLTHRKTRPSPTPQRLSVWRLQQAPALVHGKPISQADAELLCSLDSLDAGGQFWTEQSTVGGFECQAPHCCQAKVDRGCGEVSRLQFNPVPQDDMLAESQPWLGTVPAYEIAHCECVSPSRIRGPQAVQH